MPKRASIPLTNIETDGEFVVDSVSDRIATQLKKLNACGFLPGVHLHVTRLPQEELILRVRSGTKHLRLPLSAAAAIQTKFKN